MRVYWLSVWSWAALSIAASPVKIWIELRDKGPVGAHRPSTTLRDHDAPLQTTNRAWENSPVYEPYLKQLRDLGFTPDVVLKWQNRVSGWTQASRLPELGHLSFVRKIESMPRKAPYVRMPSAPRNKVLRREAATQFGAFQQIFDTTQASFLRAALATTGKNAGQGLRVAIIDADFDLGHEAFAHLKQSGLIADQWDFVANKAAVVRDTFTQSHGAAVLSLLGGKSETFEGLVPEAKYLLYRSENIASETYVEDDYVAAAMERAVDSGAQVISISLGYRYDYSDGSANLAYSSMNGGTHASTKAALGAARRGVLVIVSMGNEENRHPAPTISAPADADSILSVGILDLNLRPCSYSSTGPTFDGRIKPEISTIGPNSCETPTADPRLSSGVEDQGGTSFAAPVIAGIAALLRQLHPAIPAQTIRLALMATGAKSLHPDNAAGYGLVRAGDAHRILSSAKGIAALEGEWPLEMKGILAWDRTRARFQLTWKPGMDPSAVQLWDMQGRRISVQGGSAIPAFWIDPGRQALGAYAWRILR